MGTRVRRILSSILVLTGIVAIGVIIAIIAKGIARQVWRVVSRDEILTPCLLLVTAAGGVGVFSVMFAQHEIHEDILWIRSLELAVPLLIVGYAIWRLIVEMRQVK